MSERSPEDWMRLAVELSKRGFPAPNPRVGCVIVQAGEVVGQGFHEAAGLPHAEVMALREAGTRASGADVYVTLEPCNHHGRTPPCSQALVRAGVRRVFYACSDPNPRAAGGAAALAEAGIEVVPRVLESEAASANEVFLHAHSSGRVFVVLKAAITLDGRLARPDGTSRWITGPEARAEGHRWRAELGGVLVGYRTALLDDPKLTARIDGVVNPPSRWVWDPQRELPSSLQMFQGETPARRIVHPDRVEAGDLVASSEREALQAMRAEGQIGVMVEGGAQTHRRFLESGEVDQIDLYVAPKLFGEGIAWLASGEGGLPPDWTLHEVQHLGPDVRLSFRPKS